MTDDLIARLRIVPLHSGFGSTCHAAADALEVQAKLIEKLKANAVFWQKDALHTLKVKNEGDARIAELEAALKPFAEIDVSNCADGLVCYFWGFGDNAGKVSAAEIRAACAALEKKND